MSMYDDGKMEVYDMKTGGAASLVTKESIWSYLPGRYDGPADAYRHGLLAAELTRKYGPGEAREKLKLHEWTGNLGGQTPESAAMDYHNNELGILLGNMITSTSPNSFEDVLKLVREVFDNSDGSGGKATFMWLPDNGTWQDSNPTNGADIRLPTNDQRVNWEEHRQI